MKTGKRFLSIFLAFLMIVLAAPVIPVVHAVAPEIDWSSVGAADGTGSADDLSAGGTQGGIIKFGAYPQTKVTDSATISALNSRASGWQSYGYYSGSGSWADGQMTAKDYMQYCDVKYGGSKYRGVTFSQYRPEYNGYTSSPSYSYQDDNGYTTGKTYWFQYEPLQWKVLDPSEGLVMCVSLIDSQPYNNYILSSGIDPHGYTAYWGDAGKNHYANDYENSSLRQWLNETFYATAFTESQQNRIAKNHNHQNNDGYYTLTGNTNYTGYDSSPTNDKIFLLSYDEVLNSSYGFSSFYSTNATVLLAEGTNYAKCQGLYVNRLDIYNGNSYWWLRSPGSSSRYACSVEISGSASFYYVNITYYGVRPACVISNLASGITNPDDETITVTGVLQDYKTFTLTIAGHSLTMVGVVTIDGKKYSAVLNVPAVEPLLNKTVKLTLTKGEETYIAKKIEEVEVSGGSSEAENEERQAFIDEHVLLAKTWKDGNIASMGFFNHLFKDMQDSRPTKLITSKINDFIVAGKDFLSFDFNFSGYQISTNYYDLFLADIITKLAQTEFEEPSSLEMGLDRVTSLIQPLFNEIEVRLKKEGEYDFDVSIENEFIKWVWDKDAKLGTRAENVLNKLLKDDAKLLKTSSVMKKLFNGVSLVADGLSLVLDMKELFRATLNAYVVKAYTKQMNKTIFDILEQAGNGLKTARADAVPQGWKKVFAGGDVLFLDSAMKNYSTWFLNSLAGFREIAENDELDFENVMDQTMVKLSILNVVVKDTPISTLMKMSSIKGISSLLTKNLSGAAAKNAAKAIATRISASITAYTATVSLTEWFFDNSKTSKNYQSMNYSAFIEWPLSGMHNAIATKLLDHQTYENAKLYDLYFNLLKATEQTVYGYCESFASDKGLITIQSKDTKEEYAQLAAECHTRVADWKNKYRCHFNKNEPKVGKNVSWESLKTIFQNGLNFAETELQKYREKTVVLACPIDVEIKGSNSKTVLLIQNEKIITCEEPIVAAIYGDYKIVTLPDTDEYSITITPYDNETMDYFVSEYQGDEQSRQVEFYSIPIEKNVTLRGKVSSVLSEANSTYSLNKNGRKISCDYDSKLADVSCSKGHTINKWTTVEAASCTEIGTKKGYCTVCGYLDFEAIDKTAHTYPATVTKQPTCTVPVIEIKKCTICGQLKMVVVPPLGHTDKDNDGKCDRCKEQMTGDDHCPQCGKIHKGFFQKIVGFFHKLIYRLTHLFG